jgi:hypothetical protein
MVVKFTELRDRLPTAEASTADFPDRTAAGNATLDIVTDPPSTDTNTNPNVTPARFGVKLQLLSISQDPMHRNSDVCNPPSDVPTTNVNCENVEEALDVTSPVVDPDASPTVSCVSATFPLTSVLTPESDSSAARLITDSSKMFRSIEGNRVPHT